MYRRDAGFTLIELLIVVVIIGILAAIAIPKFSNTRERAYIAAMKTDLRNLAVAQEAHSAENGTYYTGAIPDPGFNFAVSQGVSITLSNVSTGGWSALATHGATDKTCSIYYGSLAVPLAPATENGMVGCDS